MSDIRTGEHIIAKLPIRGYLYMFGTAFFTAVSYGFAKVVSGGVSADLVTFYWFFGAFFFSMFATALIPSQRAELKSLGKYTTIFILSSVVTAIGAALWIYSIRTIGTPLTSFLMKSQTLFSLLLGMVLLGERLNKWETVGVTLTITGAVIVAYQREGYLFIGTLVALLSAFFYSLLSFLVKRLAQNLNMLTLANVRSLGVSIVLFIYLVIAGRFGIPGLMDLVLMSLGGLTGAYIAKACQFQSIKLLDVSHSTAVMPLESILVVLISFFFFDDLPSAIKLIGGACIIIGVIFLVLFRGEKNHIPR